MADFRNPLLLNVGFIIHETIGYSRDFPFDFETISIPPDTKLNNLNGLVRVTRTAQGLLVQVKMQAYIPSECVRCLTEFALPLRVEISDLFVYPPTQATDPVLSIPETGILDLTPVMREVLLLAVPLQPLCRPDCKGLCPECGNNRNETVCHHPSAEVDPRLSALRSLLPDT